MSNFSVSNGQIVGPDGKIWNGAGIDLYDFQIGDASQVLSDFPGIGIIRLPCYSFSQDTPAYLTSFINQMTSRGIVVEIENHTAADGNVDGGGSLPYTGSGLTQETNWYASLAAAFKNNPYVWFGTLNEPLSNSDEVAEQVATYNAIRATGNNSMILMEQLSPGTASSSTYANMTNIAWDDHFYGWLANYSTDQGTVTAALQNEVNQNSNITDQDGAIPTIIGEYGNSTNGNSIDANADQVVAAVGQSGLPSMAWEWSTGGGDDLTDGNGNLSSYGQQVAAVIAARAASSPPSTPSSPGSSSPPSATASANDTVIHPNGGTITDASGDVWAITSAGSITENGTLDPYSFNVTEMAYVGGHVYQENSSGQWYEQPATPGWWDAASDPLPASSGGSTGSSGSGSTPSGASFKPSPNNTVIAAGGTITDNSGNTWTIGSDAKVLENGAYAAGTGNVIELAFENGTIWQENQSHQWWSWNPSTSSWGPTAQGVSTSPVPASSPPKPTLAISAPASPLSTYAGVGTAVKNVSVSDSNATETATLKITASAGTLSMTSASGGLLAGSGTGSITISGNVAALDADLAHLTYTGSSAGAAVLSFALSDTPGATASKTESVTVGADTLTLQLSEDAYLGNADFVVKMDGKQLGGPTAVTALHSANATQAFSYTGTWGGGTHSVEIDFTNDAYGGSPAKDRNLYVNQVSYDGATALTSTHPMYGNGAFVVQVGH